MQVACLLPWSSSLWCPRDCLQELEVWKKKLVWKERLGREDLWDSLEKESEQKQGCISYAPLGLRMRLDS